jgi:hypothetical protein
MILNLLNPQEERAAVNSVLVQITREQARKQPNNDPAPTQQLSRQVKSSQVKPSLVCCLVHQSSKQQVSMHACEAPFQSCIFSFHRFIFVAPSTFLQSNKDGISAFGHHNGPMILKSPPTCNSFT